MILLAESRFNRTLRARQMEKRGTFSITGEYVTMPNDFLEFRAGYINTSPRKTLQYLSPQEQDGMTSGYNGTIYDSSPVYFSVVGDSFRFTPAPSSATDAVITYYAAIPPLSLNATNWLLTAYPDAYLYGAIVQGSGYIQDDPRVPGIKALYDEVITQIMYATSRARWGGPGMRIRAA